MKILVTGAYGQLGSEIKELAGNYPGFRFVFTDADSLDITDSLAVGSFFNENNPDWVVNCAAYTAVEKAEKEQEAAAKINSAAPGILAAACKKAKARLIHVSTDYVFSGKNHKPYNEDDEVNPLGAYGLTKLAGEKLCLENNPDTIIIRTSWLYSQFGNNFVKTMLRLGKERESINVVFDQVGTPTYAGDLAGAILEIIRKCQNPEVKFTPGIYHYSNEGVCSWYDFTLAIHEMAGIQCKIFPVESKDFPVAVQRPFYSVLNKGRIKSVYQIIIPYWKDSLKICIEKILKE